MVRDYIEVARPKDWVKNVFVLLPIPFALADGAKLDPRVFALGLIALCLTNSGVYVFNDVHDAERDKLHEKKRRRPVASGRITPLRGYLWSALLAASGLLLASVAPLRAFALIGAYLALNLIYTFGGKSVALLDVFLLASGFVLRVLIGCALVAVAPSHPMLLCSYALALFLALAKRRADVVAGLDGTHRPSLLGYNLAFLDQAMTITASLAIVGYALYSMESSVLVAGRKFASLPFVMFGVLNYLRMVHVRQKGASPVDLLLSSPALWVTGIGWLLSVVWSLGWS